MEISRRHVLGLAAGSAVTGTGVLGYRHWRRDEELLQFGEEISEDVRTRCRRVDRRLPEIVGRSISEPVSVQFVELEQESEFGSESGRKTGTGTGTGTEDEDEDESEGEGENENNTFNRPADRIDRALEHVRHVTNLDLPPLLARPAGSFNRSSRVLSLVDPETVDRSGLPDGISIDEDEIVGEPLIAHELTHAIQGERFDGYEPADGSTAAAQARRGVTEGTADYVAGRYRATCLDGEFDPCVHRAPFDPARIPLAALANGHQQYVNGRLFVHAVVEDRGWEAVWDLHRSLPATTVEITFPEQFLAGTHSLESATLEFESEPAHSASSDWLEIETDRLGAFELYTKLFALGLVSPTDDEAAAEPLAAERTSYEWGYRSDLLRRFRGDRITVYGYVDDLDRLGARWRTAWQDVTDAEAVADAVERGYDEHGTAEDGGWYLDGAFHTLERADTTVTFGMGPTPAAVRDGIGVGRSER